MFPAWQVLDHRNWYRLWKMILLSRMLGAEAFLVINLKASREQVVFWCVRFTLACCTFSVGLFAEGSLTMCVAACPDRARWSSPLGGAVTVLRGSYCASGNWRDPPHTHTHRPVKTKAVGLACRGVFRGISRLMRGTVCTYKWTASRD